MNDHVPPDEVIPAGRALIPHANSRVLSAKPIKWPPPQKKSRALVPIAPAAPPPKITKPGIYDMDIELYHTQCCEGFSVSSSGLRLIENKSLLHFWDQSCLNPDAEPFVKTPSMTLGSAAHHLLLGESGFAEKFAVRPKEFKDWRTGASQQWKDEQEAEGKTVLVEDQLTAIKGISRSLARHPFITEGLMEGDIEQSLIWKDKETGIWLKARPDMRPRSSTIIGDLKTTADAGPRASIYTMDDYGYHMQLALVGMGMQQILGVTPGNSDYVLVFVETKRPYAVTVRPVDIGSIMLGRMQIRRALRKLATALEADDWPGYENDLTTISLSKFRVKMLEEEAANGLLPQED